MGIAVRVIVFVMVGIVVLALMVALFLIGAGPFVIVPVLVGLAVLGWAGWALAHGVSPDQATRKVKKAELLGPGGPDDPDQP